MEIRAALLVWASGYALALEYGQVTIPIAVPLALLLMAGLCVTRFPHIAVKVFGHTLFLVLAVTLAAHWWPGFYSARIMANVRLSPEAVPYSMAFNLDKPWLGAWVLLCCSWAVSWVGLRRTLAVTARAFALTALICLPLAWSLSLIDWSPKWPAYSGLWMLNNLLLVSLVEELLFRSYLQGGLERVLAGRKHGRLLALGIAALVFGLVHVAMGWQWMVLGAIAGVGYGLAWRTGGLAAAVGAHFLLNLLHYVMFTYPMRAG